MNPPVQPPCANPPSRSSPGCPGAWITPSSDTYSTTTKFLTQPPLCSPQLRRSAVDPLPAVHAAARNLENDSGAGQEHALSPHLGRNYRHRRLPARKKSRKKTGSSPLPPAARNSSKAAGDLPVVFLAYLSAHHRCCSCLLVWPLGAACL